MRQWNLLAAVGLALGGLASPAIAQLCAIDPISPLCCPSPCPIWDPVRVTKLLADSEAMGQAINADIQLVHSAEQIRQAVGDAKASVDKIREQVKTLRTTVSEEVTDIEKGLSKTPAQALSGLRRELLELPGGGDATQRAAKASARSAAAQDEQIGAFAVSLMRVKGIPGQTAQKDVLTAAATTSQQLQSDLAVNSLSRLALYQDAGAIHQLAGAWLAQRASQSAVSYPNGAGGEVATLASPPSEAEVSDLLPPPSLADALDQLVALHDARAAAQTLLAAYPDLQQTLTSAALAVQFARDAESTLKQSLQIAGLSITALADVEKALAANDRTGWLDVAKTGAAQQAAAKVSGALSASGAVSSSGVDSGVQQLKAAMTSWLDAEKQNQYWASLAVDARKSIASLDGTLGTLSDHVGADVAGAEAAKAEQALLAQISADPAAAKWKAVLDAAARDPSAATPLKDVGTR